MNVTIETKNEAGEVTSTETVDYLEDVLRAASERGNPVLGALGLAGETGEYIDMLKKDIFHDVPASRDKILKELGDVLWYLVYSIDAAQSTIEEVAQLNIKKLRARYPQGFTTGGGVRVGEGAA